MERVRATTSLGRVLKRNVFGMAAAIPGDAGFANKVLNHDLSSLVGHNGVYGPPGRFPTSTWEASNYFRDVVFTPNVSAGLTSAPANLNLGNVNVGSSVSQTLTFRQRYGKLVSTRWAGAASAPTHSTLPL